MKAFKSFAQLGLVFAMTAALAACGGAPSEAEVRQVLEDQIQLDLSKIGEMTGTDTSGLGDMVNSMMPKVEKISLQGCDAEDNGVYKCSVEATVIIFGQEQTNIEDIRLKKNKEGEWRLMR